MYFNPIVYTTRMARQWHGASLATHQWMVKAHPPKLGSWSEPNNQKLFQSPHMVPCWKLKAAMSFLHLSVASSEGFTVYIGFEYIIILIIIIVVVIDFGQLQFCQTVHLESSFFFKPLIFPRKVISRQIVTFCCWLVFLWPAG